MINKTKIEWCDYSVNPIRFQLPGQKHPINLCIPCSEGCRNCYASAITKRFKRVEYAAQAMAKATPVLVKKEIQHMLRFRPKGPFRRWAKPRLNGVGRLKIHRNRALVFVGDMTDLFGDWVPFEMLDKLFAVFALRPDVDWLLLTKRPERMAEYLNQVMRAYQDGAGHHSTSERLKLLSLEMGMQYGVHDWSWNWPLPNVWLGTSVEDQATADARIPHLLKCPAAVRFVSAEPLLGAVDFDPVGCEFCESADEMVLARDEHGSVYWCQEHDRECGSYRGWLEPDAIDWIITGGESGPGARPCNIEWLRSTVEQCKQAGVPVFVKQLGSKPFYIDEANRRCGGAVAVPVSALAFGGWEHTGKMFKSSKGADPSEWPDDLRDCRQWPVIGGAQ